MLSVCIYKWRWGCGLFDERNSKEAVEKATETLLGIVLKSEQKRALNSLFSVEICWPFFWPVSNIKACFSAPGWLVVLVAERLQMLATGSRGLPIEIYCGRLKQRSWELWVQRYYTVHVRIRIKRGRTVKSSTIPGTINLLFRRGTFALHGKLPKLLQFTSSCYCRWVSHNCNTDRPKVRMFKFMLYASNISVYSLDSYRFFKIPFVKQTQTRRHITSREDILSHFSSLCWVWYLYFFTCYI